MTDTRDRNSYFPIDSLKSYFDGYRVAVHQALESVDPAQLLEASYDINVTTALKGRVFVGGNGGSASISDHLTCDLMKGCFSEKNLQPRVHSLVGSPALTTAIANDLGYEKTLSFQLEALGLNNDDLLILISSSGNSPNIIRAAEYAHSKQCLVIGMTGFDGGELKKLADASLHVASHNYGVIEDCHQILMHVLAQYRYKSTHV